MRKQPTILITGTSSGIGRYCASALKKDGWQVFATARRNEDIEAVRASGIDCFYLDYREPDSIAECLDQVLGITGGRLDALFNNGGYVQAGAVEDLPVEALRAQLETNFFGYHDLTRRVVPVMRSQGHGRIVNCSSIAGLMPTKFRGAYCASKHALEGLSTCLRLELSDAGIHVSLIEPGPVESKIATNALPWFEKFVDIANSPHRSAYQAQLDRMNAGGIVSVLKPGPEAVYKALRHALSSRRPKAHYVVTVPARGGALLKKLTPQWLFYRIMALRG